MPNTFKNVAKAAKFCQIWSHWLSVLGKKKTIIVLQSQMSDSKKQKNGIFKFCHSCPFFVDYLSYFQFKLHEIIDMKLPV